MPIALLIADTGDVRDAVGLFLAGRGWTTVPVVPDPDHAREAFAAVTPELVAIDFRGRPDGAAACLRALAEAGVPIVVFNAPAGLTPASGAIVFAQGPEDVPAAPGAFPPPHAH